MKASNHKNVHVMPPECRTKSHTTIANTSFENVVNLEYVETAVTDLNHTHKEIKST
jgi:hypothetical protein